MNKILENSRYAKFHIHYDGVIEQISGYGVPRFRKTRTKNEEQIIEALIRWLGKAGAVQPNPISVIGALGNPKKNPVYMLKCAQCPFSKQGLTKTYAKRIGHEHADKYQHQIQVIPRPYTANPPKEFCAGIEGTIYNVVKEIRAEKTRYLPGLYKHPFSKRSKVKMLALDTGDILIHSQAGENLWKRD